MLTQCPECKRQISDQASTCPHCGNPINRSAQAAPSAVQPRRHTGRNWLLGTLIVIVLAVIVSLSQITAPVGDSETSSTPEKNMVALEVKTWECHSEYGYMKTTGQVVNISSNPLNNVEAVSQYYTKGGTFVKSADALIDYNPILPGQTSPFSTMTTGNPAIEKCDLGFKTFFGGSISAKLDPAPAE